MDNLDTIVTISGQVRQLIEAEFSFRSDDDLRDITNSLIDNAVDNATDAISVMYPTVTTTYHKADKMLQVFIPTGQSNMYHFCNWDVMFLLNHVRNNLDVIRKQTPSMPDIVPFAKYKNIK
jgi:hypothetical protein